MASVSLWDISIGKALNFIITSGDGVLNLSGGVVTMHLNNGQQYPMEVLSVASATVRYVVSAGDAPSFQNAPHFIGQLVVSFGTNRFPTSTFEVIVHKSVQRC